MQKSGHIFKNLHDTATFIAEHAVRAIRACAHRRPERGRRIYRAYCVYHMSSMNISSHCEAMVTAIFYQYPQTTEIVKYAER
jgi:hypothetical protein